LINLKGSSWPVYLATAVSESTETIEEVYEPFLIQEGFYYENTEVEKSLIKLTGIWLFYNILCLVAFKSNRFTSQASGQTPRILSCVFLKIEEEAPRLVKEESEWANVFHGESF
jgi:hypothetical protein